MKKTLLVSMAMVVGFMRISTVNDQLHDLYWWYPQVAEIDDLLL